MASVSVLACSTLWARLILADVQLKVLVGSLGRRGHRIISLSLASISSMYIGVNFFLCTLLRSSFWSGHARLAFQLGEGLAVPG